MRTPDGRPRVPTPAESDLIEALSDVIERALADPDYENDPFYAAHMAVSAAVTAGWTPPTTHGRSTAGHQTEDR